MNQVEQRVEAEKARWRTAERFAEVLDEEIKAPHRPLLVRVITWFNLCRLSQELEKELVLAEQPAPADLQLHRALLSLAIGSGEFLVLSCAEAGELKPLHLTSDSLAAKIESLRITFEQWHTELKPERQRAALQEVFGVTS
ncbi:MAG: hypothetical protein O2960_02540 [Verrucomicrobia bacterium]|nr:hypothetical protein [Verrucomicrobiota bacterium]